MRFNASEKILTGARYDDVENTPFTPEERDGIKQQLRQLKEFVKDTYSLSEAHMMSIDAKVDYLEAATERLNRKDWLLIFYGVMFPMIVTDLLPREVVYHVIVIALQGLGHLLEGGGTLLLPPPI